MDVFDTGILAKSQTTYRNILETLGGTMVVGREDDVCTTGATLFAATEALRAAGAKIVWCLTFART